MLEAEKRSKTLDNVNGFICGKTKQSITKSKDLPKESVDRFVRSVAGTQVDDSLFGFVEIPFPQNSFERFSG